MGANMKAFWLLLFFVLIFFDETFGKPSKLGQKKKKAFFKNSLSLLNGSPSFTSGNIRTLPGDLKPSHYEIMFHPYFEAPGVIYDPKKDQTFDGRITISINVLRPTSTIVLNAHELEIDPLILLYSNNVRNKVENDVIKIVEIIKSPENETITLKLEREVWEEEKLTLKMDFSGKIGINNERGFYKSEKDGNIVYATMFETRGARAAFPCFDEPNYKANFSILLVKPKPWIALSNGMEIKIEDYRDGYDFVVFENFVKMSTYLIAFGIGDLVKIEGKTADGILNRIWTFRSGEGQMKAALESAIKCTDELTNYTNFSLKFQKIDHLAIPEKQFFAMENPGLIIYDERMLFLDDNEKISYDNIDGYRQWYRVAGTVCHEIAHQWFGNLLTNKWWGDSWLHEGFANYFETYTLAKAYPKEKDLIDVKVATITMEHIVGFLNSDDHPVVTENGDFDQYTYYKGGAILRQLEAVISPEIFQKAIQNYIKTFAYSNANSADFIQKVQESVDETDIKDWCSEPFNVTSFMNLWLNQKGHPILNIDYFNGTFSITQNVYNGSSYWALPVFVQFENGKNDMFWLAPEYICKDGRKLPATTTIQSSSSPIFINRDLLSIAKMEYSSDAAKAVYNALITNENFQISPASMAVFYESIFQSLNIEKNVNEEILSHQKSAKVYDIYINWKYYG